MDYIQSESPDGCIFCSKFSESKDRENFILYRGDSGFVMLNIYPYNNGHIMIAPIRHIGDITLLEKKEICEMMCLVQKCVAILSLVYKPGGFNIGMNLGTVAGAGIADHLHIHIVPRWQGDTNFMPVLADTKVMPQCLKNTYECLFGHFSSINNLNK